VCSSAYSETLTHQFTLFRFLPCFPQLCRRTSRRPWLEPSKDTSCTEPGVCFDTCLTTVPLCLEVSLARARMHQLEAVERLDRAVEERRRRLRTEGELAHKEEGEKGRRSFFSELNLGIDRTLGRFSDTETSLTDILLHFRRSGYIWFDWANKKYDVRSPFPLSFSLPGSSPPLLLPSVPSPTKLSRTICSRSLVTDLSFSPCSFDHHSGTTPRRDTTRPISRRRLLRRLRRTLRTPLRGGAEDLNREL